MDYTLEKFQKMIRTIIDERLPQNKNSQEYIDGVVEKALREMLYMKRSRQLTYQS